MCVQILDDQLDGCRVPSLCRRGVTRRPSNRWFEWTLHSIMVDLCDDPLLQEEICPARPHSAAAVGSGFIFDVTGSGFSGDETGSRCCPRGCAVMAARGWPLPKPDPPHSHLRFNPGISWPVGSPSPKGQTFSEFRWPWVGSHPRKLGRRKDRRPPRGYFG